MTVKAKSSIPRFPKTDIRLIGVWRSEDKRRWAEWTWPEGFSPKKKELFKSISVRQGVAYTRNSGRSNRLF
jgi:hypothetical protein